MTRTAAGALVAIALAVGIGLRGSRLDVRPMHHDEANQAVKFGDLLERGDYRYDYRDHHGPTLYYLTLPSAWLGGRHTLASLDEATLRRVPVAFGMATIVLLPLLAAGIGRTAMAVAAILMAISPAMVFYSRMFIHEALLAFFTLAFVIAVGRIATTGGGAWWLVAGAAGGAAAATKETFVIMMPAAIAACAIAWWSMGSSRLRFVTASGNLGRDAVMSVIVAAGVAALFYSSFLSAPAAIFEPFRGARSYLARGIDPVSHAHPWNYYLRLLTYTSSGGLTWTEGSIIALFVLGAAIAWRRPAASRPEWTFWARYLACDVLFAGTIFSAIPYKTPWNVLPFYVVAIVVAGVGFASLVDVTRGRVARGALLAALAIASVHLGWQAWRAAVVYAADPRNPYVYAQTVPDAVRMAARIRDLSALDSEGARMQVSVIASPYEQWPLPWYLRAMPNVGYWTAPGDPVALRAPVIVSEIEHTPALDAALGDRYVSEFYGLRPEVPLALYTERGLWDRFLQNAK